MRRNGRMRLGPVAASAAVDGLPAGSVEGLVPFHMTGGVALAA